MCVTEIFKNDRLLTARLMLSAPSKLPDNLKYILVAVTDNEVIIIS